MFDVTLIETHAVCLHQSALKEQDAIVWFYTDAVGLVRAVIKGLKKTTSKQRGAAIPLTLNRVCLTRRQSSLYNLSHYERIDSFPTIHQAIERIAVASTWTDVIRYLGHENDIDSHTLFHTLVHALYQLDTQPDPFVDLNKPILSPQPPSPPSHWLTTSLTCHHHLMQWAGFPLDYQTCILTEEPLDLDHTPIHRFSPSLGGFLHHATRATTADTVMVSTSTMLLMAHPHDQRFFTHAIKAHRFLAYWWQYRLERTLNSFNFLIHLLETTDLTPLLNLQQQQHPPLVTTTTPYL